MDKKFTAIDLFAGIGGFRLAIERCGGHCVAFSEINSDAIDTYLKNHSEDASSNLGDITKLKDLPPHDLLTAGVPCQSWSIAGRNLGFDDDRGQLWNDALYLLKKSRPRAFIFENVKGLADPRNKNALDYIMARIKDAGYFAQYYVLNSFDYGIPQSRVRIFIIGFSDPKYFRAFRLPGKIENKVKLKDIMDDEIIHIPSSDENTPFHGLYDGDYAPNCGTTSLSSNNNGFNDYFLFNDLRNGETTIHSWDIIETTQRQKDICLLLLRNRRKKDYGPLDGNPLSLEHFRLLDKTISACELEELVSLDVLKEERYAFSVIEENIASKMLSQNEKLVLAKQEGQKIIPDKLVCDREIKIERVNVDETLASLEAQKIVQCCEIRYEFRHTKISTGLFGINRIFLPSSNIFPTLVASDSNDYLTPVSIPAKNAQAYRRDFMKYVLNEKNYRKISKPEACRIQGFPVDFRLPDSRPRWMKLIGNSVSVPLIEMLVNAVVGTGVFEHCSGISLKATNSTDSCDISIGKTPSLRVTPAHTEDKYEQLNLLKFA